MSPDEDEAQRSPDSGLLFLGAREAIDADRAVRLGRWFLGSIVGLIVSAMMILLSYVFDVKYLDATGLLFFAICWYINARYRYLIGIEVGRFLGRSGL